MEVFKAITGSWRSDNAPHSHNLMSGGKLYVKDEDYEHFLKAYSGDFVSGVRTMTLSEIITKHAFKMFFDLDFIDLVNCQTNLYLRLLQFCRPRLRSILIRMTYRT